jgi:phosphohistidine phosphatase
MKQLILMRHAKAQALAASGEDFDRPLNERGLNEALIVAQSLKDYGIRPDIAMVSPALRTHQTFVQLCRVFGTIEVYQPQSLYEASAQDLRRHIETYEDRTIRLLLIGHNPALSELVVTYLIEGAGPMSVIDSLRSGYPTASATVFDVDVAQRLIFKGLYQAKDRTSGQN